MGHSYVNCDCHIIFATKDRTPVLSLKIRNRLYSYLGAVAHKYKIGLITAGGTEDHVHLLVSVPATMSIASVVKLLKGSSSRWLHTTFPPMQDFAWQGGYSAFSVSRSLRNRIVEYIRNQDKHHRNVTFEDEHMMLLKKHDLRHD